MEEKVVAVDFDGVIVESAWPRIGEPHPEVVDFLKDLKAEGVKLILWTCREGQLLDEAVQFCRWHGIEFDAVNDNLASRIARFGSDSRKIHADYYIDDKNVMLPGIGRPEQIIEGE